jgi:hypothetical protein
MKFSDFENKQNLVGKIVLHENGTSYGGVSRSIKKITKVTATGFKVQDSEKLYSLINGDVKQTYSRSNIGQINQCTLITDEQADQYRTQWKEKKEKKELVTFITANISPKLSLAQLTEIKRIIENQ